MGRKLLALSLLALLSIAAFLLLGTRGNWEFALTFRAGKLIALICVAIAVAVATVVFQTLCANRILTPSIMGFDTLYALFQTLLVFLLGCLGYAGLNAELKFLLELLLLGGGAFLLFGLLLGEGAQDLFRMLLAGVIFGILFRSVGNLLQRLIDPNEFAVVQGALFASFNSVNTGLLRMAVPMVVLSTALVWWRRHRLDVLALGRNHAISLGLNHRGELFFFLSIVSILVAVSTALVGPVAFFGLLISAAAHEVLRTHRHSLILVAASLLAIIALVGGQAVFERVLGMAGTLGLVVEFLGGLVFLAMIFKRGMA
ncbi:iron chelate uptake ABC transporter family permease subunit [Roseibium aggregatum]|uniref:Iron chelate uptake ABC transporter family permease subunit n=1 Tax=Roseibium aggregatum TaxID=187304 RepID=A0A939J2E0_9HYPH|nr:iron chelate uptake ABC transporter family permease subunit [Roseibium aggregatum]MBN9671323.1 iron chelate uptake ABC transporter family permease subunit [Roseibium aggregatum]